MKAQSLLHLAASHAQPEECRRLLKSGAQVDALDDFDCTPLANAMLQFNLIRLGGVSFSTDRAHRSFVERLERVVWVLRDHGADFERIHQSVHGPFAPEVEAWAQDIDRKRVSHNLLQSLLKKTAPATAKPRSSRL